MPLMAGREQDCASNLECSCLVLPPSSEFLLYFAILVGYRPIGHEQNCSPVPSRTNLRKPNCEELIDLAPSSALGGTDVEIRSFGFSARASEDQEGIQWHHSSRRVAGDKSRNQIVGWQDLPQPFSILNHADEARTALNSCQGDHSVVG